MDREWGNRQRMRKWTENEEINREWGNQQRMRKWRENEERNRKWGNRKRMRKWTENEEIEREWGNQQRMRKWKENEEMEREWHFLILSPFPLNFLIFPPFPLHFLILSPLPRSGAAMLQRFPQPWEDPPPCWEKFPNNIVFFCLRAYLSDDICLSGQIVDMLKSWTRWHLRSLSCCILNRVAESKNCGGRMEEQEKS